MLPVDILLKKICSRHSYACEQQTSKHDQPYDTKPTKGPEADQKLRYGGRDAQDNTTKPDEGPTGKAAAGLKP